MDTVRIGIIGFGTVGTGVVRVLQVNTPLIEQRTGIRLELGKIVDRNIELDRGVRVPSKTLSTRVEDVLEDPTIDIVVELIGGYEPAKEFILTALRNNKHVVTANKALLSRYGPELHQAAQHAGKQIFYEASVAGGIPIILAVRDGLVANRIQSIEGILNGTCNFILTKMDQEKMEYAQALRLAQENGFAEADPTLDVNGKDSMHKLVVLSRLAFDAEITEEQVDVQGIEHVSLEQIALLEKQGKKIKLIAKAEQTPAGLTLTVQPVAIDSKHPFYAVDNETNAVLVRGDFIGELLFVGKGAGMDATASAVVADIVEAARSLF